MPRFFLFVNKIKMVIYLRHLFIGVHLHYNLANSAVQVKD